MPLKRLALLSLMLVIGSSLAQNSEQAPAPKLVPPWVVQSESFLLVAFNLKTEDVRKLLPKDIEPLQNKEGTVGAAFEMYETKRITGLPNYKTAFIVVDVQGHNSRDGMPGHFVLWGRVNPQESLDAIRGNFGFPYAYEANIHFLAGQDSLQGAVGGPGKEIVKVKMAAIAEQVFDGQGYVNLIGMNADSGIVKAEIPYLIKGHFAKVLGLEVQPKGDPVLKLIKNATPAWALISNDQIFSWPRAVSAD